MDPLYEHKLGLVALFGLTLFCVPTISHAAQWCVVNNAGNTVSCYSAMDVCRQVAARYGEACILIQDAPTYSAPSPTRSTAQDFNEGYASGQALGKLIFGDPEVKRRQEQRAIELERLRVEQQQLELMRQQQAAAEAQRHQAAQAEAAAAQSAAESRSRFPEYERTCASIGFRKGTTAYGECVLELDRRARGQ